MDSPSALRTPGPTTALGVALRGVGKRFGTKAAAATSALLPTDLEIPPGQFVSLVGPSGCGKTTLLRIIAGLEAATEGEVDLSAPPDHPLDRRRDLAFVFQSPHLMPWRTVRRNVELPLEIRGVPAEERRELALAVLESVGLGDAAARYPAQLSGGMAMRVSLARALVTRPRLLLMDEPFGALDEITRTSLDERLHALWAERRMTVVFVTHAIGEAVMLAERAIVMSAHPGRVVLDQPIELPAPRTVETRSGPEAQQWIAALRAAMAPPTSSSPGGAP